MAKTEQPLRYMAWLAIGGLSASCRFDLPKVSGADVPVDGADAPVDGSLLQYSSCMGLEFTCGASGTGNCCQAAEMIPGGTFLRGYDAATDLYNDMNYPAAVSTFVLDKYEVT